MFKKEEKKILLLLQLPRALYAPRAVFTARARGPGSARVTLVGRGPPAPASRVTALTAVAAGGVARGPTGVPAGAGGGGRTAASPSVSATVTVTASVPAPTRTF